MEYNQYHEAYEKVCWYDCSVRDFLYTIYNTWFTKNESGFIQSIYNPQELHVHGDDYRDWDNAILLTPSEYDSLDQRVLSLLDYSGGSPPSDAIEGWWLMPDDLLAKSLRCQYVNRNNTVSEMEVDYICGIRPVIIINMDYN